MIFVSFIVLCVFAYLWFQFPFEIEVYEILDGTSWPCQLLLQLPILLFIHLFDRYQNAQRLGIHYHFGSGRKNHVHKMFSCFHFYSCFSSFNFRSLFKFNFLLWQQRNIMTTVKMGKIDIHSFKMANTFILYTMHKHTHTDWFYTFYLTFKLILSLNLDKRSSPLTMIQWWSLIYTETCVPIQTHSNQT